MVTQALCGPKFLRGIVEPCDGFCCGLGRDGKPDPVLTEKVNKRANAWRRVVNSKQDCILFIVAFALALSVGP